MHLCSVLGLILNAADALVATQTGKRVFEAVCEPEFGSKLKIMRRVSACAHCDRHQMSVQSAAIDSTVFAQHGKPPPLLTSYVGNILVLFMIGAGLSLSRGKRHEHGYAPAGADKT